MTKAPWTEATSPRRTPGVPPPLQQSGRRLEVYKARAVLTVSLPSPDGTALALFFRREALRLPPKNMP